MKFSRHSSLLSLFLFQVSFSNNPQIFSRWRHLAVADVVWLLVGKFQSRRFVQVTQRKMANLFFPLVEETTVFEELSLSFQIENNSSSVPAGRHWTTTKRTSQCCCFGPNHFGERKTFRNSLVMASNTTPTTTITPTTITITITISTTSNQPKIDSKLFKVD